jgi:hypothetical protein
MGHEGRNKSIGDTREAGADGKSNTSPSFTVARAALLTKTKLERKNPD